MNHLGGNLNTEARGGRQVVQRWHLPPGGSEQSSARPLLLQKDCTEAVEEVEEFVKDTSHRNGSSQNQNEMLLDCVLWQTINSP